MSYESKVAKIRSQCKKQLEPGKWYRQKFVAEVIGYDQLDFKQTTGFLGLVAKYETSGNHMIRVLEFKEDKKVSKKETAVKKERTTKRVEAQAKEAAVQPRIQYTKCIRTLVEQYQREHSGDLTCEELILLYLGRPLEDYYIQEAEPEVLEDMLTDEFFFDCYISKAISLQIGWNMYNLSQTKNKAIKKYMVRDTTTHEIRAASLEEISLIESALEECNMKYIGSLSLPVFSETKKFVDGKLEGIEFMCVSYEIEYLMPFLHREQYTPEIIRSKILSKWASLVEKEIENITDLLVQERCRALLKDWEAKYIQPYLLEEQKGA